jgi:hypothetical protein
MADLLNPKKKKALVISAIVFVVLFVVPGFLFGMYSRLYATLTNQVLTQQQTLADISAKAVKVKVDRLVNIAFSLASSTQLVADAKGGRWTSAIDVARDLENNVDFYDPFIDRTIIYEVSGTQEAAYPALTGGIGTNASGSSWYGALIGGNANSYVSSVTVRLSLPRVQVINIAVPIKSGQSIIGFVVLQIPTNSFPEYAASVSLGEYGFAYIVDAKGNVITHPKVFSDNSEVINYSSVLQVQKVMAGQSGTDIVVDKGTGEKSVVTYEPVEKYGWGIIMQELYSEAFSTSPEILFGILFLAFCAIAIDFLIAYAVFRFINKGDHE